MFTRGREAVDQYLKKETQTQTLNNKLSIAVGMTLSTSMPINTTGIVEFSTHFIYKSVSTSSWHFDPPCLLVGVRTTGTSG